MGSAVRVAGWVHRRRDHGGLIFVDLRDRTGLVQLVFNPDAAGGAFQLGHELRAEDVVSVAGEVVRRAPETVNPELPTGEFEVRVAEATLLADAETPPFEIESFSGEVGEEMRLRHRYLDLRRERMQAAIELRHRVTQAIRRFMDGEGFLEIETPVLTRSTPEGARDFLVPSRLQPGSFYALPQSPQLFKQLLMVAGFERYYQIARCFRDEDLRADRQLDFTQLDVEMSFVGVEDVLDLNERLLAQVLGGFGIEVVAAVPADPLRRGDRPLRHRQARHALRARAPRPHGLRPRDRVQRLSRHDRGRRRRPRPERRPARAVARRARRAGRPRRRSSAPRDWCGRSWRPTAGARRSPSSCRPRRSRR